MATRLRSAPGEEFRYSNVGYSVLAAVVEKASGLGYEEFLAKHLFRPAGMADTGYVLPQWDRSASPSSTTNRVSATAGRTTIRGLPTVRTGTSAATAASCRRRATCSGGTAPSAETSSCPRKPGPRCSSAYTEVPDSPETYGYGWALLDNPYADGRIAWHDGGNDWSMANFARTLSDDTVVFWATNQVTRDGRWNLDENPLALTLGMLERVRE